MSILSTVPARYQSRSRTAHPAVWFCESIRAAWGTEADHDAEVRSRNSDDLEWRWQRCEYGDVDYPKKVRTA
jgi:hypothetical protein